MYKADKPVSDEEYSLEVFVKNEKTKQKRKSMIRFMQGMVIGLILANLAIQYKHNQEQVDSTIESSFKFAQGKITDVFQIKGEQNEN